MRPPSYFDKIQRRASERWDQLESDPELAGPWHQLFRQVQSPRHVLSELLQNADDAGAKSASVRIEDNSFIFEHDGGDFDADQFASLCRFGFSNKRTLHTIGFRGVGFKSTFSLGDTVEVHTPTLAVCFKKNRFTEPVWLSDAKPTTGTTVIQVRIADCNRASALRKNFEEWARSPASLLFFNHLKELAIEGNVIRRQWAQKGPLPHSSWVKLIGTDTRKVLVVQSEETPFPPEAAEEIRAERGVLAEDLTLPPCRVEIVLGLSDTNRLYVVLPTGAELELPFSCNAPFIQDTARTAIKDPAMSPTNQWLLERAGKLAVTAMLDWLDNEGISLEERADAYNLLKEAVEFAPGLNGACSQTIVESMLTQLDGKRLLLTTTGKLAKAGECIAVPDELFGVWGSSQLLKLLSPENGYLLASEASDAVSKLKSHGWVSVIEAENVLQQLEKIESVPCPASWPQLHALWSFVENELHYGDWNSERRRRMRIVPADGSKILHAANGVVRLSSRRDLLPEADWKFVMNYTPTVNSEWIAWISKHAPKKTPAWNEKIDPGYALLQVLALHEPSSVDRIAAQASLRIFTGKEVALADCVRITHIMAALGATIPEGFRFVSRDLHLRDSAHGVVVDETGCIEDIVPATWAKEHFLHEDYFRNLQSCKPETWKQWICTNKSKLHAFIPLTKQPKSIGWRSELEKFLANREGSKPREYRYKNDRFVIEDYDFPPEVMQHWKTHATASPRLWSTVVKGMVLDPLGEWENSLDVTVRQISQQHTTDTLSCGGVLPAWLIHLRAVRCLADTHGNLCTPPELLLRTPDTESLLGIEPFVDAELDDTPDKKRFLRLLGVRDTPADADRLFVRLSAMSAVPQPLQHLPQISRFYEALDRIALRCAPAQLNPIKEAFIQKALILTYTGEWLTSGELSIFPDEDNAAPSIHPSFRTLALWPRIGVSERPALERAIEWLNSLEAGAKLDANASRRVRTALQREPLRIWNECQHWLTLDSTWESVGKLKYRLTMQSLTKWGELFQFIKAATANLQMLSVEATHYAPFAALRNLGDVVEFRVTKFSPSSHNTDPKPWLTALANGLCRVKLPNEDDTLRVQTAAQRLRGTTWNAFTHLDVTPYVEGAPAGEPFTPKALWQDSTLYVAGQSTVRLYRDLADELARPFSHAQVSDAIAACIDRTPEFVAEYLEAHFERGAQPELPARPDDGQPESQAATDESLEPKETSQETTEATNAEAPVENAEDVPPPAGEEGDEEAEPKADDTDTEKEETKPPTLPKPTLIELYARQRGFRWHAAEKCFAHADGRWIEKSASPFNWEEHAVGGELVCRVWVTEQKLAKGVEIAAELWTLIGQQPATTVLVVLGEDHAPCALTGQEILELKDSRQIMLHPARYRIVENQ